MLKPQEIARRAYDIFAPMLAEWRRQGHPEPSLAAAVGDRTAARVLEQDFRDIGSYLIGSDDRGTRIELGVMVDFIAELRRHAAQGVDSEVTAELLAQEFEVEKHKNAGSSFLPPPMVLNLPLSLRVARDLNRMGLPADAVGLKDMLVEFTHRIVLQDGNVTAKEIEVTKEIEEFLTDMISNAA